MKKSYKKELAFCYCIYMLLFIGFAISTPMMGSPCVDIREWFNALMGSVLWYPFLIHSILTVCVLFKIGYSTFNSVMK